MHIAYKTDGAYVIKNKVNHEARIAKIVLVGGCRVVSFKSSDL